MIEHIGKTDGESLLSVVGYIISFRLGLVQFKSLRILVQPKDLNIFFSQLRKLIPWRI